MKQLTVWRPSSCRSPSDRLLRTELRLDVGHIKGSCGVLRTRIGAEIATVALLYTLFKKRGWF